MATRNHLKWNILNTQSIFRIRCQVKACLLSICFELQKSVCWYDLGHTNIYCSEWAFYNTETVYGTFLSLYELEEWLYLRTSVYRGWIEKLNSSHTLHGSLKWEEKLNTSVFTFSFWRKHLRSWITFGQIAWLTVVLLVVLNTDWITVSPKHFELLKTWRIKLKTNQTSYRYVKNIRRK